MKRAALYNLGCKVNAYETEAMQEILEKDDYQIVDFNDVADVYIVNTCTVTNMADRKSRQMLNRAKKQNRDAIIIAAGCYVQDKEAQVLRDMGVDIILGNNNKNNLIQSIRDYGQDGNIYAHIVDINNTKEFENLSITKKRNHTRVILKIQDGCDQFCSYCIIPTVRGRVRSRKLAEIVEEVKSLASQGTKEVVLTGINLSSYGLDLGSTQKNGAINLDLSTNIVSVVKNIAQVNGIERIRIGSLEPRIVSIEFLRELHNIEEFCPHFHLSLQSGSDSVLKRMNRHYTTSEYREIVDNIRKIFTNPTLTTDIIVGFPGESEKEFFDTKNFVDEMNFYETHVFKYSKREKTKAASMPNQVSEDVKSERSHCLLDLNITKKISFQEKMLHTNAEILVEDEITQDGELWYVGHTKEYIKLGIQSPIDIRNQIIEVEISNGSQFIH